MSQGAERLPAAEAKGFFAQQSPGFPTCGGVLAECPVQSDVGCSEKSLKTVGLHSVVTQLFRVQYFVISMLQEYCSNF